MTNLVDTTHPARYSFADRSAARFSLSKSRFFLVLGLGLQFETSGSPFPAILCSRSTPGAVLRVVRLTRKRKELSPSGNIRVLIELKGRHSARSLDAKASRITSAMTALFSHVHHTWISELEPYQIPQELIRSGKISVEQVEELEQLVGRGWYVPGVFDRVTSCVIISPSLTAMIFYLLPIVLQNEDLFDACNFFRACCSEFSFMDGVVHEVLREPKGGPKNETERLGFEQVVLQSLRTIEALVGEPGSNEQRFHERLKKWQLEPNERVGFPGHRKQRLEDRIRWLQDARDSATAHGRRRRPTPFTWFEVMEAQHLADLVLERALWRTAELHGREGRESEVAFLLEAMWPNYPGWARDKQLFRGKRAVDLARIPGGLEPVLRFQRRRIGALYKKRPTPRDSRTAVSPSKEKIHGKS